MEDLFTLGNLGTLLMLIMLQAVLGFDNLLYISLESKRAPQDKQKFVRTMGIGIAIVLRIALLFLLRSLAEYFEISILDIEIGDNLFDAHITLHGLIFLAGGIFIVYTAIKEIWHMITLHKKVGDQKKQKKGKVGSIITWIVVMNVVFSFDSILSAMALTDQFAVMTTAIVIGGILMIWLAGTVARFLEKNKLYEVLGLFILLVVGIMLLTEGGHLSHIVIAGENITPMTKTTFYFVVVILVLVDIVQGRYQKNLIRKQKALEAKAKQAEADDNPLMV